ncbi:succinate dehydrogenase, hydrophobic membrane anchor protein [Oceaniglobus roseus]|uniref:succinate dehydrogenase, hydrophobic membrane anchor protein n=1 Tax=Oceaniglobus roseus TaxID=1737570 RepID=UPI000C7F0D96|nr:succinate dehydrogenase, hydrophobic membrane anchor protein [Kandeliimicrobium roseum]
MTFMTDRKRAVGLGSAKSGTAHHWQMTLSSVGLLILVPLFVFTFGPILGGSWEEVTAYYAQPLPAVIAGLTLAVGFLHFRNGCQVLIEDYTDGVARKALIVAVTCLSWGAAALGLLGIVRLAL